MEVPGMDEANKTSSHLTSASAFVEGGIQEACEDACSICLEVFTESDPSTVTSCKHEFHLQCVLEWGQRSSNCPMCWRSISLKDPSSQELLEAVDRERSLRFKPARNSRIFHHPTFGDFEFQHLPVYANDTELEDRIIQHLAAAAAMGRTHHVSRRDGSRSRSSAHGRRQLLVFSPHPSVPSAGPVSATPGEPESVSITVATPSLPLAGVTAGSVSPQHSRQFPPVQNGSTSASASGSNAALNNRHEIFNNRNFASQSSLPNPDRAGSSDFHSLSESWKSRLNAMSMKYKDSISKSTKGWKEKLFSRNTSIADIRSEVRREVNAGIANVSCMMEHLETREDDTADHVSSSDNISNSSATEHRSRDSVETHRETPLTDNNAALAFAASSVSR